jgi:transposase-like protein
MDTPYLNPVQGLGAGKVAEGPQQVRPWSEAKEEGKQAFPGQGRRTAEQERIRQLERENEILRGENRIPLCPLRARRGVEA